MDETVFNNNPITKSLNSLVNKLELFEIGEKKE